MTLSNWKAFLNPAEAALRSRLRADPYYRLRSLDEVRVAAALGIGIDANRASVDDWLRLPGISIRQARSLVTLCQSGVQFHCIEDVAAALSLPVERLRPLGPVLRFYYYAPGCENRLAIANPNRAAVEQLSQVPGIDRGLAEAIVRERELRGAFRNLVDLQQRLGLTGDRLKDLMHYLQF